MLRHDPVRRKSSFFQAFGVAVEFSDLLTCPFKESKVVACYFLADDFEHIDSRSQLYGLFVSKVKAVRVRIISQSLATLFFVIKSSLYFCPVYCKVVFARRFAEVSLFQHFSDWLCIVLDYFLARYNELIELSLKLLCALHVKLRYSFRAMNLLLQNDSQNFKVLSLLIKLTNWHAEMNKNINKCFLFISIQLKCALKFAILLTVYIVFHLLFEVKLFCFEF
jgi:hypothetical protein